MLIIYDKQQNKIISNLGTNSLFPEGNIPNLPILPTGQIYLKCIDHSELAQKIMKSYDYELIFDENNNVIDVNVAKTLDEYLLENPIEQQPNENEILWQTVTDLQLELLTTNQTLTDAQIEIETLKGGVA